VDEKLLKPILTNLLSNAIKFLGSTVDLALSAGMEEVIFQIKDEVVFRQQISNYCLSHFIGVGMSATYQVDWG